MFLQMLQPFFNIDIIPWFQSCVVVDVIDKVRYINIPIQVHSLQNKVTHGILSLTSRLILNV